MGQGFNRWAPMIGGLIASVFAVVEAFARMVGSDVSLPKEAEITGALAAAGVILGFALQVYGCARKVLAHLRKKQTPPPNTFTSFTYRR